MKNSSIADYFVQSMIANNVLKTGEFLLNSGQTSMFYYDFGNFSNAKALNELGFVFAHTIDEFKLPFDVLFGTAYKGIPLVTATACQYFVFRDKIVNYAFNRKEKKNHGEGGRIIGAAIKDKNVLILDDVITSGKALGAVIDIVKAESPKSISILVGVNRTGIESVKDIPVNFITNHEHILHFVDKAYRK